MWDHATYFLAFLYLFFLKLDYCDDFRDVFKCIELHPRSRKKGKANVFKGGVFKTSSK